MKRLLFCVIGVLVLACSAAFADTYYKLTFLGPTGPLNDAGQYNDLSWTVANTYTTYTTHTESVYYGPYSMSVYDEDTHTAETLALVCIDGATNFTGTDTYFMASTGVLNTAALYIARRMLAGDYTSRAQLIGMNLALWTLMDPTNQAKGSLTSVTFSSALTGADTVRDTWLGSALTYSGSYKIYIPGPGQMPSQRFLTVPEPSLIILLGIGLLCVSLVAFRRQ